MLYVPVSTWVCASQHMGMCQSAHGYVLASTSTCSDQHISSTLITLYLYSLLILSTYTLYLYSLRDLLGAHRWRWSPGTAKSCAHVELNLAVNRTILGDLIL